MVSGFEESGLLPELPLDAEMASHAGEPVPHADGPAEQQAPAAETARENAPLAEEPTDHTAELMASIAETLERLTASSDRYHARAEQREKVIDNLNSELDRLRQGERRSLLRPLLVEVCRLRNDLLRQAEDLPGDFDADRARVLLLSYADSIELALEDNGVVVFAPEEGDRFEPRLHRRVGGEPADDPGLAGRVARARRSGYLDLDTNIPVAPAEVVLFTPVTPDSSGLPQSPDLPGERTDPGECDRDKHDPADAIDEGKQP